MQLIMSALIVLITLLPKISIINIGGTTTGVRLEDLLIALFFLLFIIYKKKNKIVFSKEMQSIIKVFIIFSVAGAISCVYGTMNGYVSITKSAFFFLRKIEYFLFIYVGYYYSKNKSFEKLFVFTIWFHFIFSIAQYLGLVGSFKDGRYIEKLAQGRITSTFNGSYEYGAFLLIIISYFLNNLICPTIKAKRNDLICSLIGTICIIISESRTSLVIEVFIILLIMKNNNVLLNKKMLPKIILLSIFVLPFIVVIFTHYSSRFKSLNIYGAKFIISYAWKNKDFDLYAKYNNWYGYSQLTVSNIAAMGYDGSFYQRVSHWFQLIDGLSKKRINWLIGMGISLSGNSADGNYIRIMVENGLIGLALWIILMKKSYNSIISNKKLYFYKYSFICTIIGAIFIDLFESSKIMMLMWFIIGYVINKNTKEEENEIKKCYNNK